MFTKKNKHEFYILFYFFIFFLLFHTLFAKEICFVALDVKTDRCKYRGRTFDEWVTPASTFKIPLSLIAFDSGILIDEFTPLWVDYGSECSPKTWMANSVVWYSQILSQKIGLEHLHRYLADFDYGNHDVSGDHEKNNGLTHAWLSSSLKISAMEQIYFLKKLVQQKLPVSKHAVEMTKNILFVETLENNWKLFGKAGTGYEYNDDNSKSIISWYVGWIERGDQFYLFALQIHGDNPITAKDERIELAKKLMKEFYERQ
jgi:beta-lactamase class D